MPNLDFQPKPTSPVKHVQLRSNYEVIMSVKNLSGLTPKKRNITNP